MRRLILIISLLLLVMSGSMAVSAQDFRLDFGGTGYCRDNINVAQIGALTGDGVISATTIGGFSAPECLLSGNWMILTFSPRISKVRFHYATRDGGAMEIQVMRGTKVLNQGRFSNENRTAYEFSDVIDRIIITEANGGKLYVDDFAFNLAAGESNDAPWDPRDGRVGASTASSLNVFCNAGKGLSVHSESARYSFEVPFDNAPPPAVHTLLKEARGVRLYRLADGGYQAMETMRDGRIDLMILYLDASCNITRWRRGVFYPTENYTEIYSQSAGWDGAPLRY
jgi:hypothetical protein